MKGCINLHLENGFSLIMSLVSAGDMGPSGDRLNPVRSAFLGGLGIKPEAVLSVRQIHSRRVLAAEDGGSVNEKEADGIVSADTFHVLAVTVADCMPIFLLDTKKNIRALLHSGWQGTGIILDALKIMTRRYGCSTGDISACLGPSIRSCCYTVSEERARQFEAAWGEGAVVREGRKTSLSLADANCGILKKAGVNRITLSESCTGCSAGFGSFRREGPESFTRMIVLSVLNDRH